MLKNILFKIKTYILDIRINRRMRKLPECYKPKLVVIGYARHGKDTATEFLGKYGLTSTSSSLLLAKEVVYPTLKEKYGYATVTECFNDRHNHRAEWYNIIKDFAEPDLARIGEMVFKDNDIYCGIRDVRQLYASIEAGIVDGVFWVDASARLPPESKESCTVREIDGDYLIYNNISLVEFEYNTALEFLRFLKDHADRIGRSHSIVKVCHPDYSNKSRILRYFPVEAEGKLSRKAGSNNLQIRHVIEGYHG